MPSTTKNAATRHTHRAADGVWRRLTDGVTAPWLAEIRDLRTDVDEIEATLDIWSAALTAALQDPARRETAAKVLARLRKMTDG